MIDMAGWELKFYEFVDKLPFDLAYQHHIFVHFAFVLPIIAFVIQWISLTSPDKGYNNAANVLFYFGGVFILLAYVSGFAATPDIKPILSIPGQNLLDSHQKIGKYLVYIYIFLMILKAFSISIKKEGLRYLVTALMIGALITLWYEVKIGHELVFQHGAGIDVISEEEDF